MAMEVLVHLPMLTLRLVGNSRCDHRRLCFKVYRQVHKEGIHNYMQQPEVVE